MLLVEYIIQHIMLHIHPAINGCLEEYLDNSSNPHGKGYGASPLFAWNRFRSGPTKTNKGSGVTFTSDALRTDMGSANRLFVGLGSWDCTLPDRDSVFNCVGFRIRPASFRVGTEFILGIAEDPAPENSILLTTPGV